MTRNPDEDAAATGTKAKAVGNSLLSFARLGSTSKPQLLKYSQPQIVTTSLQIRKRRRTNRNKKNEVVTDSDSDKTDETAQEDSDDDDEDLFNLATIVGDPDRVQRVVVAGPAPEVPWILNAFGRLPKKQNSPRKPRKRKHDSSSDEDGEKEKKKRRKLKPRRTFRDDKDVLILHDVPYQSDSKVNTYKRVIAHRCNRDVAINARFFCMMYTEVATQRLWLRIAVTNALPTRENYTQAENAIWVQDFPELSPDQQRSSSTSSSSKRNKKRKQRMNNPTHTTFSSAFFNFVAGGLALPEKAAFKSFVQVESRFDFSASIDVRPVVSIAGDWRLRDEVEYAGGFTSLAHAIKGFDPDPRGAWRVEYITPTSLPIDEPFLEQLYAAAQGVTPFELDSQATDGSRRARRSFSRDKIKIGYPTVSTVQSCHGHKIGQYALGFETANDVDFDRLSSSDARRHYGRSNERMSVMCDLKLKSGRVNHSNVLLIFHTDVPGTTECEAFVYVGSHTPTSESWGKQREVLRQREVDGHANDSTPTTRTEIEVELKRSEFGVVSQVVGSDWAEVRDDVNELVPYERRSLKRYRERRRHGDDDDDDDDDVPFPTPTPRVLKSRKKKKQTQTDGEDSSP